MLFQSFTGDGVVGGVSPNDRLYSQSYPSIYSSAAATGPGGGQNSEAEREKCVREAEESRQRSGIADLEEEDEDEEEDMDERRPYGNESAGEEPPGRSARASQCHASAYVSDGLFSPLCSRCLLHGRGLSVSGLRAVL